MSMLHSWVSRKRTLKSLNAISQCLSPTTMTLRTWWAFPQRKTPFLVCIFSIYFRTTSKWLALRHYYFWRLGFLSITQRSSWSLKKTCTRTSTLRYLSPSRTISLRAPTEKFFSNNTTCRCSCTTFSLTSSPTPSGTRLPGQQSAPIPVWQWTTCKKCSWSTTKTS